MRSLFVRSPWSVVRGHLVWGAMLFGWLVTIHSSPAQEASAPAQEKKPAAAPTKGSGPQGAAGMMSQMQGQMKGMMGGGGRMGMMGQMSQMKGMMGGPGGMMGGSMGGQAGKPAAELTLEEMLNKALKDNPDIRVAEAKVREAEAELNRTRLQTTQKVLAFHHSRESQKALIKVAEEDLQRIQKLEASKAVSQEDVKQAQQRLSAAKAKLAEIEGEMPYLLGQQQGYVSGLTFSPDGKFLTSTTPEGTVKFWDATTGKQREVFHVDVSLPEHHSTIGPITYSAPEATTIAEKVRKALDTKLAVDYQDKTVDEVLKDLEKKVPELSFHAPGVIGFPITLKGQISLKALLQLIQDTCHVLDDPATGYSFAVRDYGLLFAPSNRIPPGAIRLQDLQKERAPSKEEKKEDGQKKGQ